MALLVHVLLHGRCTGLTRRLELEMAKTIHYDDDGSTTRLIAAWQENARTHTPEFIDACEAEIMPRISTSGSYAVDDSRELSGWISSMICYLLDNADVIRSDS